MTRFNILTACVLQFAIVGSARADFADNLVAYWPFEDNLEDSLGTHHGEAQGADPIAFEAGVFGQAIHLNGEDQHVLVNGGNGGTDPIHDEAFDFTFVDGEPGTGSMTVSAWFKVDAFDTNWQALIAKGEDNRWRLHRRGDVTPFELAFTGGNGDTDQYNLDLLNPVGEDASWHHVVALVDADLIHDGVEGAAGDLAAHSARLYLDGALISSKTNSRLGNNDQFVRIGENPDARNREWEGFIDDVAIWGRALTDDEIGSIYSEGNGNSIASLLNPGLPGDFNADDVVDLADFDIMVSNFNSPGKLADGDFDFNGQVNLKDYVGFREVFNAAPVGAAASVPEPSGLVLLALGALAMVRLRRVSAVN